MKEMVYKAMREKPEILDEGTILGRKYYIISYGTHPCAYLENAGAFKAQGEAYAGLDRHGGVTFFDNLKHAVPSVGDELYIGWDYDHSRDYTEMASYRLDGEVVNTKTTYEVIAYRLSCHSSHYLVGWTDGKATHYDVLFSYSETTDKSGSVQGGTKSEDLFVSILGHTSIALPIATEGSASEDYIAEKLVGLHCPELVTLIYEVVRILEEYEGLRN